MSLIGRPFPVATAGGFDVANAIHFDKSASQAFSRAFGSAGDQRTLVASFIVRRGSLGTTQIIFVAGNGTNYAELYWNSSNRLQCHDYTGATRNYDLQTTAYYRDVGSVYLVQLVLDTTNSSVALWVNGEEVTDYATNVQPSLNFQGKFNSNLTHYIGRNLGGNYLDGNLSECVFLDGSADPTGLFEIADNGEWRAVDPTTVVGAAGAKSFYITDATGADQVNGNDFTPINTPTDSLDTPSTVYPTLNPIQQVWGARPTITNGGLSVAGSVATVWNNVAATVSGLTSGKWVFATKQGASGIGECNALLVNETGLAALAIRPENTAYGWAGVLSGGDLDTTNNSSGTSHATGNAWASGDLTLCAFDVDNLKVWFGKYRAATGVIQWADGSTGLTGDPAAGTDQTYTLTGTAFTPAVSTYSGRSGTVDFGQSGILTEAMLPTGFQFINSANLYANDPPAIEDGSAHFQTALHTGTGSAITINQSGNSTFTPDFVWTKGRSGATDHILSNVISGTGKYLSSNAATAETTDAQALTAFGSGSISYGTLAAANTNAATYVDWMWKGGGAGVANTDGSITSTVSANTTAGFSIVTYTGTGANATIGHGLGSVPSMIIVKRKSTSESWRVYTSTTGNTAYMNLENTDASDSGANMWNNTSPTSSVFSISTQVSVNSNGGTFVAICFAPIASFSAISAYTGNASTDGPFIYTGFKPAFVLVKNASAVVGWQLIDNSRDTFNQMGQLLYPNVSTAEATSPDQKMDFLANGFKCRGSGAVMNGSGNTIIYAAFASVPSFGATPAKAR